MTAQSKWLNWTPETPSHGTDKGARRPVSDDFEVISGASAGDATAQGDPNITPDRASNPPSVSSVSSQVAHIRARFEEAASRYEAEGCLRVDAELRAYDEVLACVQCRQDTEGEANAVRVAGGGWLHTERCYSRFFNHRSEKGQSG